MCRLPGSILVAKANHFRFQQDKVGLLHDIVIVDTLIAELIKDGTDTDEFMECLHCQQEFYKLEETDKDIHR